MKQAVMTSPGVIEFRDMPAPELRLIGTLMYREPDWKKAIELASGEKVILRPLVTNHFDFADYKKAYEYVDANRERAMKVMIMVTP